MSLPAPSPQDERTHIRSRLVEMAVRAETMLRLAVRAIAERDAELARSVVHKDDEVDHLEMAIDRAVLGYLEQERPRGRDLRFATMALKVVIDVERIGDLAKNIARRALDLGPRPGLEPDQAQLNMAHQVAQMVRDAADAFVAGDVAHARRTIEVDQGVDQQWRQARTRWRNAMRAHPDQADRALALCLVAKDLERVADHAVNICEMVIFLVDGEDVRHPRSSGP